jgi:hypothetical protein
MPDTGTLSGFSVRELQQEVESRLQENDQKKARKKAKAALNLPTPWKHTDNLPL